MRLIPAAILIGIGLGALFAFDRLTSVFLCASPDGVVEPETLLELRLILIALMPVGLALLFGPKVRAGLSWLGAYIERLPARDFILRALAVGLVLRALAAAFLPLNLYSDFGDYDQLAWTWAQSGCYCENGQATGYWPPGYPFFLSRLYLLFGHAPLAGVVANVVLSLLIAVLAYRLAREAFDETGARWTLLLMTALPSQVLFVNLLASEMLFTPLFLAALLLLIRSATANRGGWLLVLGGGILLGLATLTRSLTQLFWLLPPAAWYLQTRDIARTARHTCLLLLGMAVVITPWMYRSHEQFGRAAVSLNGGVNLWIGNHAGAGAGWNADAHDVFPIAEPQRHGEMDREAYARAWAHIADDPAAFAKRGIAKAGYFFASDMTGVWYNLTEAARAGRTDRYVVLALVSETVYLLVLFGALLGIVMYLRRCRLSAGGYLLVATVAYWTAVHFVVFGHGRFHFPIMPILCAFAGLWLAQRRSRPGTII